MGEQSQIGPSNKQAIMNSKRLFQDSILTWSMALFLSWETPRVFLGCGASSSFGAAVHVRTVRSCAIKAHLLSVSSRRLGACNIASVVYGSKAYQTRVVVAVSRVLKALQEVEKA